MTNNCYNCFLFKMMERTQICRKRKTFGEGGIDPMKGCKDHVAIFQKDIRLAHPPKRRR